MAKKSKTLSTFGSRLTAVVSVTLVLIVLGALAIIGIVAQEASRSLQANIGVVVRIAPQASDAEINAIKKYLADRDYVNACMFTSADEVLEQELEYDADISDLLDGENPYQAEFDVKLKPEYTTSAEVRRISTQIGSLPQVDEVVTPANLSDNIHALTSRLMMTLAVVGAILLIISIVLIFNTISLSIYSRRFLIHTMKLVGATGAFIRRPFILAGIVNGLVAGLIAAAILAVGCWRLRPIDPILADALPWWPWITLVLAGVVIAGVLICTTASVCATNRYLRRDYDSMFTK